jgi:1,4-alpha-glucan branching enzyme
MLLLQSSDWQFIMSTGDVQDYAIRRFNGHADDARHLIAELQRAVQGRDASTGHAMAAEQHQRDDIFQTIIPSIATGLHRQPLRVVTDPALVVPERDVLSEPFPS